MAIRCGEKLRKRILETFLIGVVGVVDVSQMTPFWWHCLGVKSKAEEGCSAPFVQNEGPFLPGCTGRRGMKRSPSVPDNGGYSPASRNVCAGIHRHQSGDTETSGANLSSVSARTRSMGSFSKEVNGIERKLLS